MDDKTGDLLEGAKECLRAMYGGKPVNGWSTLSAALLQSVRRFDPDFNPVPPEQKR